MAKFKRWWQKLNPINRRLAGLVILAMLVTILAFWALGFLLFPAFSVFKDAATGAPNWPLLEGFTGLMTVSLVLGGLIFAFFDYRHKENEKIAAEEKQAKEDAKIQFEYFQAIHDRLTDPAQEEARRWIIVTLKDELHPDRPAEEMALAVRTHILHRPPGWTEERTPGETYVKLVLNNFDFIGFVARNYIPKKNKMMEWMSSPIAKVWLLIGDYVEYENQQRKEKDFYEAARYIGKLCVDWRRERGLLGDLLETGKTL